jgi:hypothetical protein
MQSLSLIIIIKRVLNVWLCYEHYEIFYFVYLLQCLDHKERGANNSHVAAEGIKTVLEISSSAT